MQRYFLVLLIALLNCLSVSADDRPRPKLEIDTLVYELGTIYKTDSVKLIDVHFKNIGNADLVIEELSVSCPCLKVEAEKFEQKRFPPNSEATIRVRFELSIPAQEFYKDLFIYSNATPSDHPIEILFHGNLAYGKEENAKTLEQK